MFKCPDEDYSFLQRLRNELLTIKTEYRRAEQRRDYFMKVGKPEIAEVTSRILSEGLKEIRFIEKEIASLESKCFVKGEKRE